MTTETPKKKKARRSRKKAEPKVALAGVRRGSPRSRISVPKMTKRKAERSLYSVADITYEVDVKALAALMDKCGVTQMDLAEACGYTGVSRISHIMRGENGGGKTRMRGDTFSRIVACLNQNGADISLYDLK